MGEIVAAPWRGTLMGNRGNLHDASGRLGAARWRHKAWICCRLEFKGRKRELMAPRRYTELFFLDEAVALAAGHRPCAECRREAFRAFRAAWAEAQGHLPTAKDLDAALHAARVEPKTRRQLRHRRDLSELPEGVMVLHWDQAMLIRGDRLLPFEGDRYGEGLARPAGEITVLTPAPTVAALAAGYDPQMHGSAIG